MKSNIKSNPRQLQMLVDFYEFTMANGYFKQGLKDNKVVFEMFYRGNPDKGGYVVCAGLAQFIEYIQALSFTSDDIEFLKTKETFDVDFLEYLANFKFKGSIYAVPEGTIVYPNTPIVTVHANLIDAQLIETMLLLTINHQSLIATKASRIVRAAGDSKVLEFGARRAHSYDAALYGARAAYIGGVHASATAMAETEFGIPAVGTMAHSWIQYFDTEYEAFEAYAKSYPDSCSLLIDTYDVLNSGIVNAIKVAKDVLEPDGHRLKGVRLDSGDLAYLSKKVRAELDANDMQDCQIIASNSIDEFLIRSLNQQGAKIDIYGVGERLITSKSTPVFGGVYKLVAVEKENGEFAPRIKISENIEKITNPGYKKLYRCYDDNNKIMCDLLTLHDEDIIDQFNSHKLIQVHDTKLHYVKTFIDPKKIVELQAPIFIDGELVYNQPSLEEIRAYTKHQLDNELWEEELRFENPHLHYVNLSKELHELKYTMLSEMRTKQQTQ